MAPLESFALRRDLGSGITFEALGNDQNYKESSRDQHGVTDFRFRYSLRAHAGAYNNAEIVAWSRAVSTPLLAAFGKIKSDSKPTITLDPHRAIALAFKPAEERGHLLRIWETGRPFRPYGNSPVRLSPSHLDGPAGTRSETPADPRWPRAPGP